MEIRGLSLDNVWDYENAFYWFSPYNRIAKQIAHWELYKKINNLPGDVLEFGVYKGASLLRWATFREITENSYTREIIGFDAFGEFPISPDASSEDNAFVEKFRTAGGDGLNINETKTIINHKGFENVKLIKGNVLHTLPHFLKENPQIRISMLHLDMDIYEPTLYVLKKLWDRVVPGGLVVIDDYNDVEGATKAVDEFIGTMNNAKQIYSNPYYKKPSYIVK